MGVIKVKASQMFHRAKLRDQVVLLFFQGYTIANTTQVAHLFSFVQMIIN